MPPADACGGDGDDCYDAGGGAAVVPAKDYHYFSAV